MAILLYLQKQGKSDIQINKYYIFVNELINSIDIPILIVCETKYDKDRLNILLGNILKLKIIVIYELVENTENNYPTEINKNYNYLHKIEPDKFKLGKIRNNKNTVDLIYKMSHIIDNILTENKVVCAHFGTFGGAFRSIGATILQDQLDQKGIPLYMIHDAFCKGRWRIYNNIYFGDNKAFEDYQRLNQSELDNKVKKKIDDYIESNNYYKQNVSNKIFDEKRTRINNKFNFRRFISLYIKLPISQIISGSNDVKKREIDKPFILYLLNKPNHWISTYANPELLYREKVIKTIYSNLPTGYDLIIKTHPHENINYQLEKIVNGMPNCYINYKIVAHDLLESADVIIFSGTTSAIDALMYKRHVIELGHKSIYFDFQNPPAKRVEQISDLRLIIDECLNEKVPVNSIYAYFKSILDNSYTFNDDVNISIKRNDDTYKKMARIFADRITEDGVI
tara:strand:+ start:1500 stop:2858 length:1359 start_codon:yes stop_codon:yes gene_type:complete